MSLKIEPVHGRRELHRFVTLPWRLHDRDPNWVPPLIGETKNVFRPDKNPFFQHGEIDSFLAYRDGDPVGRISAIRNTAHEEFHDEKVGFFGFFESENNVETARALLDTAKTWSARRGLPAVRGPVNPSTNEECGVLVEGFDSPPMIMMTHNPPYYDSLLGEVGLGKVKDLFAYILTAEELPDQLERGARIAQKRNPEVVVRPIDMKHFDREVEIFREVYNGAWSKNWGFVPMTDDEVHMMARKLRPVVEPVLVRIAEIRGEPIGFALGLPDMNQALKHANGRLFPLGLLKILWHSRRINRARILALGILPEHRRSGVDVIMYRDIFRDGLSKGFDTGEFSWILEDNAAMLRPLEKMGALRYKVYRMYEAPTGS